MGISYTHPLTTLRPSPWLIKELGKETFAAFAHFLPHPILSTQGSRPADLVLLPAALNSRRRVLPDHTTRLGVYTDCGHFPLPCAFLYFLSISPHLLTDTLKEAMDPTNYNVILHFPALGYRALAIFPLLLVYWNFTGLLANLVTAISWSTFVTQVYWITYFIARLLESFLRPRQLPSKDGAYATTLLSVVVHACYARRIIDLWSTAVGTRVALTVWTKRLDQWIRIWPHCTQLQQACITLGSFLVAVCCGLQWAYYATLPHGPKGTVTEPSKEDFVWYTCTVHSLILCVHATSLLATCAMHAGGYTMTKHVLSNACHRSPASLVESAWDPNSQEFALYRQYGCAIADLFITWTYAPAHVSFIYQMHLLTVVYEVFDGWGTITAFQQLLRNIPEVNARPAECCGVCLEDFQSMERVRQLRCGHTFHGPCVRQWLLMHANCPLCRQPTSLQVADTRSAPSSQEQPPATAPLYTTLRSSPANFMGSLAPLVPRMGPPSGPAATPQVTRPFPIVAAEPYRLPMAPAAATQSSSHVSEQLQRVVAELHEASRQREEAALAVKWHVDDIFHDTELTERRPRRRPKRRRSEDPPAGNDDNHSPQPRTE